MNFKELMKNAIENSEVKVSIPDEKEELIQQPDMDDIEWFNASFQVTIYNDEVVQIKELK